jgi:pantoate--beta-alanine ligase
MRKNCLIGPNIPSVCSGAGVLDETAVRRDAGTPMTVLLVHHQPDLLAAIGGQRPSFVPTMGALHEGHLALIRRAGQCGRPIVVSIFVNPTQFGPGEDFERYPRTLEADCEAAEQAGADVIYAPPVEEVYPPDRTSPVPPLPAVATEPKLEDAHRPGHFAGVCQVVARLFDLVQPRWAVFGEKDYQQLLVIRAMVQHFASTEPDRWPDLQIIANPTVREPDGLAMSSRNRYLSAAMRERALGLSRALAAAVEPAVPADAERAMQRVLAEHELTVDYAVVRDAESLLPMTTFDRPARALIAARLGEVRLIDNRGLAEAAGAFSQ